MHIENQAASARDVYEQQAAAIASLEGQLVTAREATRTAMRMIATRLQRIVGSQQRRSTGQIKNALSVIVAEIEGALAQPA